MQSKITATIISSILALAAPSLGASVKAPPAADAGAPATIPGSLQTNSAGHDSNATLTTPMTSTNATSTGSPTTYMVAVGMNGLAFSPSQVMAKPGDKINFMFYPKNHTVTQSTFGSPCSMMPSGINSGFMPVDATMVSSNKMPSWTLMINDTKPLWFYCAQVGHCQQGMVFAVNPTADKSFASFQSMAMGSSSSMSNSSTPYSTPGSTSSTNSTSSGTSSGSSTGSTTSGASHVGTSVGALVVVLLSSIALF